MRRLVINGDPGIRKDAVVDYDGEERICFSIARQGDWHGPERPQLWCVVGTEDERETFEKREFIPHFLEVDRVDAEAITVLSEKGDLAV